MTQINLQNGNNTFPGFFIVYDNIILYNICNCYQLIFDYKNGCCCSVAQSCPTLYNRMDSSMPGFLVLHYLPEFAQTHVHRVGDAIQPSHPLLSPSPAFNLFQHQGLFQGVSFLHQVAKVSELQLQQQSFQ